MLSNSSGHGAEPHRADDHRVRSYSCCLFAWRSDDDFVSYKLRLACTRPQQSSLPLPPLFRPLRPRVLSNTCPEDVVDSWLSRRSRAAPSNGCLESGLIIHRASRLSATTPKATYDLGRPQWHATKRLKSGRSCRAITGSEGKSHGVAASLVTQSNAFQDTARIDPPKLRYICLDRSATCLRLPSIPAAVPPGPIVLP